MFPDRIIGVSPGAGADIRHQIRDNTTRREQGVKQMSHSLGNQFLISSYLATCDTNH